MEKYNTSSFEKGLQRKILHKAKIPPLKAPYF